MAKEKKRLIDTKEQETTLFYYEILGSLAIIFSITVLAKLGTVGNIFTMFFKVAFGDWYFLVVLFVLFMGIYCLFMHKKFDMLNHRFIGFVFCLSSVLIFSHFPVHNYIESSSNSYFSEAWYIYKSFINTGISNTLGGGMIGAIFFYAMYYLLGKFGVVLLGLILMILGISLIFNKSLREMIAITFKGINSFFKGFKSFNGFFKYEVGKDIDKKTIKNTKIPLKILQTSFNSNYILNQEDDKIYYSKIIQDIFYNYNLEYKEIKKVVSYYIITLFYEINSNIDPMILFKEIKRKIPQEIFFSIQDYIISIQITLKEKRTFTLKEGIELTESNYCFGINYLNNIVEVDLDNDNNFLLMGTRFVGIKNFINSITIQALTKASISNYQFFCFDNLNSFSDIDYLLEIEEDIFTFLDIIKEKIELTLEKLNKLNVNSYNEYLKIIDTHRIVERIPKTFVFINEVNNLSDKYNLFETKLLYLIQLSKKAGFSIFYIVRKPLNINNVIYSVFESKILFKCSEELISNLIKLDKTNPVLNNSLYLEGYGDAFFVYKNEFKRFLTPKVSKSDLDSVKEYLKK